MEIINRVIEEYEQQYNIIFDKVPLSKIRDECEFWKNDWVETFKRQLRRIRKGEGVPAHDKENGMQITDPLVKNKYMRMCFKQQTNGSYYIYYFKLDNR